MTIAKGVAEQLALFPEYQLVITGHSMGGAIASLLVSNMLKFSKSRVYLINNRAKCRMLLRSDNLVLEILYLRHL